MQLRKNTMFANERDRNKERKKRGNRKYGQAKYKHARKGVLSCMIAALVVLIMIVLIVAAFVLKGQASDIQTALNALTKLTEGKVYLTLPAKGAATELAAALRCTPA